MCVCDTLPGESELTALHHSSWATGMEKGRARWFHTRATRVCSPSGHTESSREGKTSQADPSFGVRRAKACLCVPIQMHSISHHDLA